jgi:putative membrane-bound dehydrogenase-like protein
MSAQLPPGLNQAGCATHSKTLSLRRLGIAAACLLLAGVGTPLRGQGFAPDEAVKRMTTPAGFQVELVASEPAIAQPECLEFDDHGRLWVIQYLQYPNPAGLKRVTVDRYSRTVYDHVPEPPPRGPKGADRITILYDFDKNGLARKSKDFVSGLNLASGVAFGHGGVYVLQAPYLLFYPDRNGDDVPDSDPEVLLSGFGMEDASSVATALTWGPDGWLYGCQGSCVTAHIRGIEFQQGIWRYHPISHRFELFCEGGANQWGMDFDQDGNLFFSSNYGGYRMMHGVQGGYYWKSFGKHGPLHNPYTYGYFDHVPYRNFVGGHVSPGGLVYQGVSFPEKFRGKYIACDLLGHSVQWHELEPWGATFKAAYGGELLTANDTWFAPDTLAVGPDGAVYVSDWYDKRTAHPDPDADWDRSNGRVYRIQWTNNGVGPLEKAMNPDVTKLSGAQLVSLLSNSNDWFVRKARRILADRRDPAVIPPLRSLVLQTTNNHLALESLWALYVSGGFDEKFAQKLLGHPNAGIRRWTVRLLGDENKVSPQTSHLLVRLAKYDTDANVRSQLASTAKRLPAADALPILENILARNLDGQDAYIPLLLWWAVEAHSVSAMDQVLNSFATAKAWQTPMTRDFILEKLMRRYAAEGSGPAFAGCARLLAAAPSDKFEQMLSAMDAGLQERTEEKIKPGFKIPAALQSQLADLLREPGWTNDANLIRVSARLGLAEAKQRALTLAATSSSEEKRATLIGLLGELDDPDSVPPLLKLISKGEPEAVKAAALDALKNFDSGEIEQALLTEYSKMNGRVRVKARAMLLGRSTWALAFLQEVDRGHFPAGEMTLDELRPLPDYHNRQINEIVHRHWGSVSRGTPEEKLAEVRRFNNDLRAAGGDPIRGHELFKKTCEVCHRLYGEGAGVGPDLTHANRQDRDFLLVSIVDPSAVIRKEFLSYQVETTDGRSLTGLIAEQSPNSITLIAAGNERTEISRGKIKTIEESAVSLMPEGLLSALKPQELRDLFSYLQSSQSPAQPQRVSAKQ